MGRRLSPGAASPLAALHSAARPDWGTSMVLRRFAARVLRPAALAGGSIDLDYASSSYWQQWWPDRGDRPTAFLDGSRGRDVLVEADRRSAAPQLGSGFLNAPGLGRGQMVQRCWKLFEEDHRGGALGSGFWVGFSVEGFGSLQNVAPRNPLSTSIDDLVTTIVPSRRTHYLLHPEQLKVLTRKKQLRRKRSDRQWGVEQRKIAALQARGDDAPVDGGAPTHLSYVTVLWHPSRSVRRLQMEAARQFLKEQAGETKSLLRRFEAIGPLELRGGR